MRKKMISSTVLFLIFLCNNVLAYDEEDTHPRITNNAVNNSNLESYLIRNLDFKDGLTTKFPTNSEKTLLYWLGEGSKLEDSPDCRATNHFHNPLKPWNQSYMSDAPWYVNQRCSSWQPFYSNVTWGTGYLSPIGSKISPTNQWMGWDDTRDYYYWALTATTSADRETYFAKTFQALGQVLHLIQDMSVPAHVRNDFTSHFLGLVLPVKPGDPPFTGVKMNRLESYVKENPSLITAATPVLPSFGSPRVTDFWDTDQYTGDNPSTSLSLGLAEFTNASYFSDWTVPNNKPEPQHSFPYPVVNSGNAQICEDYAPGSKDLRKYISRKNGDDQCPPITEARMADHFATPSLLNEASLIVNENISFLELWLDENVHDTYAREVLPRAIGYSAGLINYFFRGNLQVMAVPIFYKGRLSLGRCAFGK